MKLSINVYKINLQYALQNTPKKVSKTKKKMKV